MGVFHCQRCHISQPGWITYLTLFHLLLRNSEGVHVDLLETLTDSNHSWTHKMGTVYFQMKHSSGDLRECFTQALGHRQWLLETKQRYLHALNITGFATVSLPWQVAFTQVKHSQHRQHSRDLILRNAAQLLTKVTLWDFTQCSGAPPQPARPKQETPGSLVR